ncbi:hypothetical protein BKA66DRAFT_460339 [Pyrenochaeta sp. MPI-SDFR-AT-0127]|nr:hypothetical protein BKA66DRAFT_460339 [Pyrenochaeta sp. MPI-SDFR-AT-0127]
MISLASAFVSFGAAYAGFFTISLSIRSGLAFGNEGGRIWRCGFSGAIPVVTVFSACFLLSICISFSIIYGRRAWRGVFLGIAWREVFSRGSWIWELEGRERKVHV